MKDMVEKPDSIIKQEGMKILLNGLGKVDAERFISLIIREPFDYTKWQETQDMFEDINMKELAEKAMKHYNTVLLNSTEK